MYLRGDIDGSVLTSQTLMSRDTGKSISDLDHLKLCIKDILLTPLGSRVMRRNYGSNLFFLLDQPINRGLLVKLYAATLAPLNKWEPRLFVSKVSYDISQVMSGVLGLSLDGWYLIQSNVIRIENLSLDFFKTGQVNGK